MSNKEFLPVRLSHLLRHCSVGAVVRGPEYLLSVMDTTHWTDRQGDVAAEEITYVEQVKSALEISYVLRKPPVAQERDNGDVDGVCVPAVRFPLWMSCPRCGLLHYQPWRGLDKGEHPRCLETNTKECPSRPRLEQVPWVLVHEEGHLTDVPWHFLAHREAATAEQKQCKADWQQAYLRMNAKGKKRRLRCLRCKANAPFDDRIPIQYDGKWQQPWLSQPATDLDQMASIVEINDARVHSPVTANALVIPPESRIRKGSVVDRVYSTSQFRREIEQARTPLAKKSVFQKIARDLRCSVGEVKDALAEIERGYPLYGSEITPGLLLESEYQALMGEIPDLAEDEDFVPRHYSTDWKALLSKVDKKSKVGSIVQSIDTLVAVNRLKEIMVMTGFQRMNGKLVPPDILGHSDWLPALELYGEGIFFSFSEESLSEWEKHPKVVERANQLRRRFVQANMNFPQEPIVDPRFIFLHSLSHLLIRQLESQAGYPASSLKERIYSAKGAGVNMAGILVYVAVPDVVGSLGGLAELAEPQRFMRLISSVFDHADWCSIDPVCAEHEGQGPSLLNRSACHACSLVPEPSCAYGNVLLDRIFVKGDSDKGIPSFLSFQG
ncbi:DUF1998 domain-containing protein [Pseudomonadales bacterium]|nr:DUF1998 domain-containing protein [Pseudomonadales bacterium]